MLIEISGDKLHNLQKEARWEFEVVPRVYYFHAENFEAVYDLITNKKANYYVQHTTVENGEFTMPNGDICEHKLTIEITRKRHDEFIKRYISQTRRIIGGEFVEKTFGKVYNQLYESKIREI